MGRQERNELFARTSFLDGANADYIEELYAKYQNNPASVDEEWQAFFRDLKDAPDDVLREAEGAVMETGRLAGRRERRAGECPRRRLGAG